MSHCEFCGGVLDPNTEGWPKRCTGCHRYTYQSPKPVVAVAIPTAERALLIIQRGLHPYRGEWALPGGYVDYREGWRDAAVREAREEVGVCLDPRKMVLMNVITTPNNFMVFCVLTSPLGMGDFSWKSHDLSRTLNDTGVQEVTAIREAHSTPLLGIPSHQAFVDSLQSLFL